MQKNSYPHSVRPISKQYIKYLRHLRLKKQRYEEGIFVLEGAKNVHQVLLSNYQVEALVATPSFIENNTSLFNDTKIPLFQASDSLLPTLGFFQSNGDILAVAKMKAHNTAPTPSQHITLVLDNIRDPGNLGTIIRIADWYGITTLVCSENTVDLYNAKVLHASMGSFLNINVYYVSLEDYLPHVTVPILGTSTVGKNIHTTQLPLSAMIVIGNESRGISSPLLPYIQQGISIPSYGKAESLNAAVATAVICDNWRQQHPSISN